MLTPRRNKVNSGFKKSSNRYNSSPHKHQLAKSLGYIIVSVIILTTFHVLESHDSPLGQVPMSPVSQTGQVKQIK